MKDEQLDQILKEWDATWARPGVGEHLRQLGRIALLLIILLIVIYGCERLKRVGEPVVDHTETLAQ